MDFEHNLIKGRIAETIFEQMLKETNNYTVLRFGYEATHAILAQYESLNKRPDVVDQVRGNPDFVLINNDKTEVYFVEVKYRKSIDASEIYDIAKSLERRWGISFVFVISKDGFHYGNVHDLLRMNGAIPMLETRIVEKAIQDKYFALSQEFLK